MRFAIPTGHKLLCHVSAKEVGLVSRTKDFGVLGMGRDLVLRNLGMARTAREKLGKPIIKSSGPRRFLQSRIGTVGLREDDEE